MSLPVSKKRAREDSDDEPLESFSDRLLPGFRELLFSVTASDVVIVCGTDCIPAHRIVLMAQSSFFKAAFSVNMKENLEGVINLPESFPVVRSILRFLYTSDYDAPPPYLMHQLQVYVAADKYGIPALKATAARHAIAHLDAAQCSFKRMTIPDLRAMTVSGTAFSTVIEYVYANTVDGSDILRRKLVRIARASLPSEQAATEHEGWTNLFREIPAFALDLLIIQPKRETHLRRVVRLCYACANSSELWSSIQSGTDESEWIRTDVNVPGRFYPFRCASCEDRKPTCIILANVT